VGGCQKKGSAVKVNGSSEYRVRPAWIGVEVQRLRSKRM